MKKAMFLILVLVLALSSIAAVPNHGVVLISVTNNAGGPMFTFRVDGTGSLKAIVHSIVGEYKGDYPITCKQEDETTVTCHAPKKLSGSWVTIEFRDTKNWVLIPDEKVAGTEYCYDVFSVPFLAPPQQGSPEIHNAQPWVKVDTYCQNTAAVEGDLLHYGGYYLRFYGFGLAGPGYYELQ